MRKNFQQSLQYILQSEGGNDDDPQDHGGRTSRGITQREYDAWRKENKLPTNDVFKASDAEVAEIYLEEYWTPFCDTLATGVDYLVFDMRVNGGPHEADLLLQQSVGVTPDGRIGPVTREAIRSADPITLISKYSDAKRNFYLSLHQPRFIHGWLNRTNFVKATALAMVQKERQK